MKIAILGANGFVGARTFEYLTLSGKSEVRGIVRRYGGLARLSRFSGSDCQIADALNQEQLTEAFRDCDMVLHAITGNDAVTARCAEPAYRAAEKAGVSRIVFISSAAVYSGVTSDTVDENTPVGERHLDQYSRAKLQAERAFLKLSEKGGVSIVILRPGIIFGPRSFWVSEPARQLLSGTACLANGGVGYSNTIYIDNLIAAVLSAAETSGINRETFLVRDEECVTWSEYYNQLATLLGVSTDEIRHAPSVQQMSRPLDQFPGNFRNTAPYKALSILTPHFVKKGIRKMLNPGAGDEVRWTFPEPPVITPHPAFEKLHSTTWKMSTSRSRDVLKFKPRLSFAEGLERSAAWLRFAGWR